MLGWTVYGEHALAIDGPDFHPTLMAHALVPLRPSFRIFRKLVRNVIRQRRNQRLSDQVKRPHTAASYRLGCVFTHSRPPSPSCQCQNRSKWPCRASMSLFNRGTPTALEPVWYFLEPTLQIFMKIVNEGIIRNGRARMRVGGGLCLRMGLACH